MSESTKAITHSINTLMGNCAELAAYLPIKFPYENYIESTINHRYNVFENELPHAGQVPQLAYYGIGRAGYYHTDDKNVPQPFIPKQVNMAPVEMLPFRVVPWDEDLSPEVRAGYRMRVPITDSDDNKYWAYYLKPIVIDPNGIQLTTVDPQDNTEKPYVINPENLYTPSYSKQADTGFVTARPTINVSATINLPLRGSEVLEGINALYNGDLRYAVISERALFTGIDRRVTGYDHQNKPFEYTEAIFTQMCGITCTGPVSVESETGDYSRSIVYGCGNMAFNPIDGK
jgi:hypothetical protein